MWAKLVAALAKMVSTKIGQWFVALMLFLGIGLATHAAVVGPAIDEIRSMLTANNGGGGSLGTVALQWLGFLNFDKAVTMLLSAYAARQTLRGAKVFFAKRA